MRDEGVRMVANRVENVENVGTKRFKRFDTGHNCTHTWREERTACLIILLHLPAALCTYRYSMVWYDVE
jgi:hypothetical protein